jgi:hypothetical protein
MDDSERTIQMMISPLDEKFPEVSWIELIECFHELNGIMIGAIESYATHKNGRQFI